MRPLLPRNIYLSSGRHLRLFSTSSSLIKVTDIPAPHTGRIRILSLNRPEARNAISRALLGELRSHIDAIGAEYDVDGGEMPAVRRFGGAAGKDQKAPTRALIIASEVETCFCAGADLKERAGFTEQETSAFLMHLRSTFTALSNLPIPTISAISSLALGGGLELALCTHLRVMASTAQVALPETRLGIIPGAGGTFRLPAIVGHGRARDLILTGRRVGSAEAYFLGLADRLVQVTPEPDHEESEIKMLRRAGTMVRAEAERLAGEICMGAPVGVRAALEALGGATQEIENKCYEKVVRTADRNEALAAFREKRLPVFTGR